MSQVTNLFQRILEKSKLALVEFDPKWHNGTGYLNDLVKADLKLPSGTLFKSCTDEERPRAIVGVVTLVGNVFFFEHHEHPDSIICVHRPDALRGLITGNVSNEDQLFNMMGGEDGSNYNLGMTLELVVQKVNKGKRHPAWQPGYDYLTVADHKKAAERYAEFLGKERTAEEVSKLDFNALWNAAYHSVLLEKDFEGDELNVLLLDGLGTDGYKARHPDLNHRVRGFNRTSLLSEKRTAKNREEGIRFANFVTQIRLADMHKNLERDVDTVNAEAWALLDAEDEKYPAGKPTVARPDGPFEGEVELPSLGKMVDRPWGDAVFLGADKAEAGDYLTKAKPLDNGPKITDEHGGRGRVVDVYPDDVPPESN